MNKLQIHKQVEIKDNSVYLNQENIFSVDKDESFGSFAKSVYKNYNLKYSKFYKMDALSKLGFLAADILLTDMDRADIATDEIAIICANSSSSLLTDSNYQETIFEIPSPAVFVYTLPNIVIGEICIRHDIKGESLFFIQESFDSKFMFDYASYLFENTKAKKCIVAWLEMGVDNSYEADMYLISKNFLFHRSNSTA